MTATPLVLDFTRDWRRNILRKPHGYVTYFPSLTAGGLYRISSHFFYLSGYVFIGRLNTISRDHLNGFYRLGLDASFTRSLV